MAKLIPVFYDLETFWSQDHSLSKMNPIVYATHRETEIISCAVKVDRGNTNVSFGEDLIKKQFKSFDWSDKLLIAHNNSGFDAMIAAWRLGARPAMWGCTLAMARPHHAKTTGLSLAKLVEHYGIGIKDNSALINTKGRHLKDFTLDEIEAMRVYNKADTDQCAALFYKLLPLTSKREMQLIDMTIRMLVEPKFRVDMQLLKDTLRDERLRKHESLLALAKMLTVEGESDEEIAEKTRELLASAPKFKSLLESLGADCPMKPSPTNPEKEVPALAKTDEAFIALQEHDNPLVAAAAAARLGVKSTLLESRAEAFLNVSKATGGRMPIAINYYGADTTGRDSGSFGLNQQNMPRVSGNPTDALRMSLIAPEGKKVVVADLSGIELRVNHFLWKAPTSMALYQASPDKADLYKDFASTLYDVPVAEVTKAQRQIGKVAHLGLGFGAGAGTFVRIAKMMGGVDITLVESKDIVGRWRSAYKEISDGWKTCGTTLRAMFEGYEQPIDPWGLCHTVKDGIKTPQGMIRYPGLRQEETTRVRVVNDVPIESTEMQWVYGYGRNKAFLAGPKIDENIVQHLAREVVMDNALQIKKETGYGTVHRVHDELIYVVPQYESIRHLDTVQRIMRTPPAWWPELITWSEGDIADSYGAAK